MSGMSLDIARARAAGNATVPRRVSAEHQLLSTIMLVSIISRRRLLQTWLRSRPLQLRGYVVQPPSGKGQGELNIYDKLNDRFDPTELAVQDVSGE